MKTQQYDLVVYIGRFQPYHNGHQATVNYAGTTSDHVLVLVGSANGPRTIRNPWTYNERDNEIRATSNVHNLYIDGLNDYTYNDNKWIQQVGEKVQKVIDKIQANSKDELFRKLKSGEFKVAVIGHDKDHTSDYLNYFPQWKYIEMPAFPERGDTIDSTKIRQLMFTNQLSFVDGVVPSDKVRQFTRSKEFPGLQKEWDYIASYKKSASAAPYESIYTTTDAVVEQSGHVLLIQRGGFPGYGLWAMPGGFLDPKERIIDGIIRELREETRLKVPEKVLRGSITHRDVFDEVERSLRGRTITHTALFQLDNTAMLPKVKGSDDAMDAQWFSLSEFEKMQGVMFEDHYSIIKNMLSRA